jgi:prepilin-type N-terminal cleavage/methylation domain-containing protein
MYLNSFNQRQVSFLNGFTLIELMVAMVIMLFIAMVTVFISASVFRANAKSIHMMQLSQEMRSSIQLISRDIRRSGYNDDALSGYLSTEPIASGISIGDLDANNASDCLQVRYEDLEGDDKNAVYRQRVISGVGRVSAHFGANADCDTALDDVGWSDVSDPILTNITSLEFVLLDQLTDVAENLNSGNTIQVGLEQVSIQITAVLRADPNINRSILTEVQLRNQYLTV